MSEQPPDRQFPQEPEQPPEPHLPRPPQESSPWSRANSEPPEPPVPLPPPEPGPPVPPPPPPPGPPPGPPEGTPGAAAPGPGPPAAEVWPGGYPPTGQPPGGYPTEPYGPGGYPGQRRTNTLAIVALICSIGGLITAISAPVGVVLGHMAKRQIAQTGEEGDGLATAALIIGYIITGLILLSCCGFIALILASAANTG